MNSPSSPSRSCLFLLFVLASGCTSAYQKALLHADQAAERGDFMTAAHGYRGLCTTEPDDKAVCSQATLMTQKAMAQAIESARPACDAGDLERCLDPLLKAQALQPDHPELLTMLEQASQHHLKHCSRWDPEGPLNTAVAGFACLQSRSRAFPFPAYQSLLTERVNKLASRFEERATSAEEQASAGAASMFWSAAQCLAPAVDKAWRADKARKDFLASSAIPLLVSAGGRTPPETGRRLLNLCQEIAPKLPLWAQCAKTGTETGQREALHLQVDAVVEDFHEKVSRSEVEVTYVSGKADITNPEREKAEQRLEKAKGALTLAEQGLKEAEQGSDCLSKKATLLRRALSVGRSSGSASETSCLEQRAEAHQKALTEHTSAQQHLANTPQIVSRDITLIFPRPVSKYVWTSPFYFKLQTSTPGAASLRHDGVLRFEDTESPGHLLAKLDPDRLDSPTPSHFAEAFLQELTPHVLSAVQLDGASRGAARRAQCLKPEAGRDIPWAQCWTEASLWESGRERPASSFLQALATSAGFTEKPQCR
jgi:hypothetical protein